MESVYLISGSRQKLSREAPARTLYISPLFKACLRYAERQNPDRIYVLSGKHGLVPLDQSVRPDDFPLSQLSAEEGAGWADNVLRHLRSSLDLQNTEVTVLASDRDIRGLPEGIPHVSLPFKGLGAAQRMRFLKG